MSIVIRHRGSFRRIDKFFNFILKHDIFERLEVYAQQGVAALAAFTPVDSGVTASSWGYEILEDKGTYSIIWTNSSTAAGHPIVIWLQYGHGTGTGGYVQGRDFINPAMRPTFDRIAEVVWKAVTSA